jgi:hypothetical protein
MQHASGGAHPPPSSPQGMPPSTRVGAVAAGPASAPLPEEPLLHAATQARPTNDNESKELAFLMGIVRPT